ncbi:MAG TPA: hypothetical protein VF533_19880 [Solirubrobacteraceae bacterium]|jgi:hypothetical protein
MSIPSDTIRAWGATNTVRPLRGDLDEVLDGTTPALVVPAAASAPRSHCVAVSASAGSGQSAQATATAGATTGGLAMTELHRSVQSALSVASPVGQLRRSAGDRVEVGAPACGQLLAELFLTVTSTCRLYVYKRRCTQEDEVHRGDDGGYEPWPTTAGVAFERIELSNGMLIVTRADHFRRLRTGAAGVLVYRETFSLPATEGSA